MNYHATTTLNRIRAVGPCRPRWRKLLKSLGKTAADDDPLHLLTVLNSSGLDDTLWVMSNAMPDDRLERHFSAWCAEQSLHLFEAERPGDRRVRDQIAMLRRDDATHDERFAAQRAAWDAVHDTVALDELNPAWDAAWASVALDSARDASIAIARAETNAMARDATADAESDVALTAAWDAAIDAARAAQERQLRIMLGEKLAA